MKTVLVVEDSDDIRESMKMLLAAQGYHVVEAIDGLEAVELAARHCADLDLILMDLNLPQLNGFGATSRILAQVHTCHLPVVAMSAHCWEFDWKQKAREAGCLECVSKPVAFDILATIWEGIRGPELERGHESLRLSGRNRQ